MNLTVLAGSFEFDRKLYGMETLITTQNLYSVLA